jgi:hypothetical protein
MCLFPDGRFVAERESGRVLHNKYKDENSFAQQAPYIGLTVYGTAD